MNDPIFEERDMWVLAADHRNSMTYWWPLIKDLPIPMPKTTIIPLDQKAYFKALFDESDNTPPPRDDWEKFFTAIEKYGYPVFMRTSHTSQKHHWKETCFVKRKAFLKQNFWRLLEEDYLSIDQIADAIVFREFIPMESYFTAWWGELPVNKEVRCHIENGELRCFHPYWPKNAIEQGMKFNEKEKHWKKKMEHTVSHDQGRHRGFE